MISTVAVAPAPVPNDVRSQSRSPPVVLPTIEQEPRVVENPTCVKLAGGESIMRTKLAPAEPTLLTTMV